jgi:hypothetical protein
MKRVSAAAMAVAWCTVACTALLGDFEVQEQGASVLDDASAQPDSPTWPGESLDGTIPSDPRDPRDASNDAGRSDAGSDGGPGAQDSGGSDASDGSVLDTGLPPPPPLPCRDANRNGTNARDQFAGEMYGCGGSVTFPDRANLCGAHCRVCTATDWVRNRGGRAPTHSYWTNDVLNYSGASQDCAVMLTGGFTCPANEPMRVCIDGATNGASVDPSGNRCNWFNCGYDTNAPNQYFGGCAGNATAGTLCCCSRLAPVPL